jgi:nitrogen fixation protein NifU and related proteins
MPGAAYSCGALLDVPAADEPRVVHEAILAAAKAARGAGRLEEPKVSVTLDNPLCGDRITLDLRIAGGRVQALAHKVRGCLLCQAAASVIGERAVGAAPAELRATVASVAALLSGENGEGWPELSIFRPVAGYKSRHECVLLPFQALAEEGIEMN